jgi:hypothetical protein
MASSLEHLQCEMFCYYLNATWLFNCNGPDLYQAYTLNHSYLWVILYGIFSVKLWVQILFVLVFIHDVWIWWWYRERETCQEKEETGGLIN